MNFRASVIAFSALAVLTAGQATAAAKPRVNEVCLADFHKYCPAEELGRGVVIRCARAHHDSLSSDCKSAVDAADAVNAARKAAKASRRASAGRTPPAAAADTSNPG